MKKKLLFIVNVDWFFVSHRLQIAKAAQNNGYEIHLACKITNHFDFLIDHGIFVHPLEIDRNSINVFKFFNSFYNIIKILKSVKPSIVHLVSIKSIIIGGLALKFKHKLPVVFSITGLGYIFIQNGFYQNIRKHLVKMLYYFVFNRNNSIIIFQNNDDINEFTKLSKNKIILIPGSGVNTTEYLNLPIPNGQPIILMASRLLKDKGVYEYFDAVKYLKEHYTDFYNKVRFVLVGEIDELNPSSINKSDLIKFQDYNLIEMWGHKSDMPNILTLASIVILPSYREGLPKILVEASSCGRPVITTDVPGCREAIINNITGLLVPVKNHVALAEAIVLLISNKKLFINMSISARKFALMKFRIEDIITKHLEIYEKLQN